MVYTLVHGNRNDNLAGWIWLIAGFFSWGQSSDIDLGEIRKPRSHDHHQGECPVLCDSYG
jgi:hypothetical protein